MGEKYRRIYKHMSKKITGFEFKKFYYDNAEWPDDIYVDDMSLTVDGKITEDIDVSKIHDNATVVINSGLCLDYNEKDYSENLLRKFSKWRKKQEEIIVNVICNKNNLDDLKEFLNSHSMKYKI